MKRTLPLDSQPSQGSGLLGPLSSAANVSFSTADVRFRPSQVVWVKCDGGFERGTVLEVGEHALRVGLQISGEDSEPAATESERGLNVVEVSLTNIYEADDEFTHADTAELNFLTYPNVLENVAERYRVASSDPQRRHWIYVYAGWILFALNPYCECPHLYTDEMIARYYGKSITQEEPHPFAIASMAFNRLIHEHQSQYVLISGESGGGKTECSKHVLRFLTWVSRRQRRLRGRPSIEGPGDSAQTLARLLTDANPLLEFFGNAKTTRNDNSSRFGKLLQIFFDATGEHLVAARLQTYLLAKSRVVQVPAGEENYHAFHSLIKGLDSDTRAALLLEPGFHSSFLGNCDESPANYYTPGGHFHVSKLSEALREFGVTERETLELYKVLVAILHLGNITFEPSNDGTSCRFADDSAAAKVCDLLGIAGGVEQLRVVLTSRQIRDTRQQLNANQSRRMMFSMAKGLYETLFHYVLALVGFKLECENTRFSAELETSLDVNILDLFGFENMEPTGSNGFEQLCINYANEQLHHHFMTEVVQREKEIYRDEGLVILDPAMLADSNPESEALTILLGTRATTPGIFAVLDDNCKLGAGAGMDPDAAFCRQTVALIEAVRAAGKASPTKKRRAEVAGATRTFSISHFAEEVIYTAEGFTERNQDYISSELCDFLMAATGAHVQKLFASAPPATTGGVAVGVGTKVQPQKSLSCVFVKQLGALLARLTDRTSCYFIKCLKPNDKQAPFILDKRLVLRQLVTGGVGPVLEIMKAGYPCRLTFDTIWAKYRRYLPTEFSRRVSSREFTELVTSFLNLSPDSYRLGTTRVFFRLGALQQMEQLMFALQGTDVSDFAIAVHQYYVQRRLVRVVQALLVAIKFRRQLMRFRFRRIAADTVRVYQKIWLPRRLQKRAVQIQRWFRVNHQQRRFRRQKAAVITIQRFYRRCRTSKLIIKAARWCELQHAARFIQALLIRNTLMLHCHAASIVEAIVRIQAHWRGYCTRKLIHETLEQCRREEAALKIWKAWRRCKVGIGLRKVNKAALPQPRPPLSPVARTAAASRAFQDARDYWEVATTSPCINRAQVSQEVLRRRRSLFATTSADAATGTLLTQAPVAACMTVARVKRIVAASPGFNAERTSRREASPCPETPRFSAQEDQMDDHTAADAIAASEANLPGFHSPGGETGRSRGSLLPLEAELKEVWRGDPSQCQLIGAYASAKRNSLLLAIPMPKPRTTATADSSGPEADGPPTNQPSLAGRLVESLLDEATPGHAAVYESTQVNGNKRTSLMPPVEEADTGAARPPPLSINKSVAWLRSCTKIDPDVEPQKSASPVWPPLQSGRLSVCAWVVPTNEEAGDAAEATPLFGSGRHPTPTDGGCNGGPQPGDKAAVPSVPPLPSKPVLHVPSMEEQENTPEAVRRAGGGIGLRQQCRNRMRWARVIQDVSVDRYGRKTRIPSRPETDVAIKIRPR